MSPPSYRSLLKPALLTAAVCLVVFGLAHAAFITWVPTPSQIAGEPAPPLLLRLAVMFAAPAAFGIPFAVAAALLHAAVWRLAHATPLASWRYGLALGTALVPPVVLALVNGPFGDELPPGPAFLALASAIVGLPALVGAGIARDKAGALVGLAALPVAVPWTGFMLGAGVVGWVVPFVASLFLILLGSGWLMARLAARPEPFSPEALSAQA